MGEIVNLRRARKAQDRRLREETAEANRIAHGRTKSERALTAATQKLEREQLEAHRIERESPDETP